MGESSININKLVRQGLHYPKYKGVPLYKRVDDGVDTENGTMTDEQLIKISATTYNSPDNIRRIFITHKRIVVHFHHTLQGTKNTSKVREFIYETPLTVKDIVQNRVQGNALREIFKPWVLSNIEEIYFDWSVVGSTTVRNIGLGDLYKKYTMPQYYKDDKDLVSLLEYSTSNRPDWIEGYPRLRIVACIRDLDKLLEFTQANKRSTFGTSTREGIAQEMWLRTEAVSKGIKEIKTPLAIKVFGRPSINKKYSLKDGIYLFDKEILKGYFENIASHSVRSTVATQNKSSDSEISKILGELSEQIGDAGTKNLLKYAVIGLNKEELNKQVKEQLTAEEISKYGL